MKGIYKLIRRYNKGEQLTAEEMKAVKDCFAKWHQIKIKKQSEYNALAEKHRVFEEIEDDLFFGWKQFSEGGITEFEYDEMVNDYLNGGVTSCGSHFSKSVANRYR